MFKNLMLSLLTALMAFTISCGGNEKKTEVGNVEADGSVQHSDINFDPMGSDSGKIAGLSTINFEYDRSRLTADSKARLAENAEWIRKNNDITVQIEGHCDSRGSVEYNLALGERRAKSVKNYLVSLGIPANRMTIISYGKERIIDSGDSDDAHYKNRRANFVPLPK